MIFVGLRKKKIPVPTSCANDVIGDVIEQPPLAVGKGTMLAEAIRRMEGEHRGYAAVECGRSLGSSPNGIC
jgi:hypothetical protein